MTDARSRLIQCFSAVFPDLGGDEIPRASKETMATWDSLANFSLIAVIEEEFDRQIGPDDVDRFVSFESVLHCLEGKDVAG